MSWKASLRKGSEIVLSTASKTPHAIVVLSMGFVDGKLLIGACQMKTSLKNIRNNNRVCIVSKYKKKYYRIKGKASVYSSGKYFDACTKRSSEPLPHHAVAVTIKEVFDLDKVERIV